MAPLSLNRYPYVLNNPLRWLDPWGLRNVEGTPTPTPRNMVQVCVGVGPEGYTECGPWVDIPRGGHDWSLLGAAKSAAVTYWEHTPDYLVYQHVVRPAWEFATSRSPQCYQRTLAYTAICGGQAAAAAATGAGASYAVYTVGLSPTCTALLASVVHACSQ
jgi:hypothetical protein